MIKKKILVFIDWYLPGFRAGGPIRSCANLIAHLSSEFEFFVVTTDTDYMSNSPYESVKKNEWNKLVDGSNTYYISKENLNAETIKRLIMEVEADFYYLNGMYSYLFTIVPLKNIVRRKKIILAVRGMLAPSAIAIKSFKKNIYFTYAKMIGLFDDVIFQASSVEEKRQIEKIFFKQQIRVVPNLPRKKASANNQMKNKQSGNVHLLNIARIAPEKNLLFALEALKKVKSIVVFDFYGPIYDNNYWEECKKVIANLPSNVQATYNGVAEGEQIFKLMENYHFLFMPSSGENFGHIILEAMSAGLPVIISDKTPWRNLKSKKSGWDISLSNPSHFSEVIEECSAMTQNEYEIMSKGADAFASEFIQDEEKVNANRQLFS
ncbi:MAG: glycosyltransferase [Bacteroidetes bacterium]|nr:glycosyltransferase [Bacteroidota bacterium]